MTRQKQVQKQQPIRSESGARMALRATEDEFAPMRKAADLVGLSFNKWAMRTLQRRAARLLERDQERRRKKGASGAKGEKDRLTNVDVKASA